MFNKIVKIFEKNKRIILLSASILFSTTAISLLMWKLLDSNSHSSAQIEQHKKETAEQEPQTSKKYDNYVFNEAYSNLNDIYEYDEYIENDKEVKDMDFISIAILNNAFNFPSLHQQWYDADNMGHTSDNSVYHTIWNKIIPLLNEIKTEYLKVKGSGYDVQITPTDHDTISIIEVRDLKIYKTFEWKLH